MWFVTYSLIEDKLSCISRTDHVYQSLLATDCQERLDYDVIDYFVHRGKAIEFMETMRKHLDFKKTIDAPPCQKHL
jgi:hypothetical protein